MKILFLDIDGVLNSVNFYMQRDLLSEYKSVFDIHGEDLDPVAVDLLKTFVIEYELDIVISSTWRKLFSIAELKDLFTNAGWEGMPIIDVTPVMRTIRGEEIQAWLESFKSECEGFVILDDDSDFTPQQKKENFIHVPCIAGLLPEHIEQMKQRLGKTRP